MSREDRIAARLADNGYDTQISDGTVEGHDRGISGVPLVTAAVLTIPPREPKLARALDSIGNQERRPERVLVLIDRDGDGELVMRRRAVTAVDTEWLAWLDDDDRWFITHLRRLLDAAHSWDRVGLVSSDPAPMPGYPTFEPGYYTTLLARTALYRQAWTAGDWTCFVGTQKTLIAMMKADGWHHAHVPTATWRYSFSLASSTVGLPWTDRDAIDTLNELRRPLDGRLPPEAHRARLAESMDFYYDHLPGLDQAVTH